MIVKACKMLNSVWESAALPKVPCRNNSQLTATKWVEHISLKICLVSLINFAGYGLLLCRYHWEKVRQITKGRDKARGGFTFVIVADCRLSAKPSALQSNPGP